MPLRSLVGLLPTLMGTMAVAAASPKAPRPGLDHVGPPKRFTVVEFRRYTIKQSERQDFARYFDAFFPDAFQQIGSIIFGQFLERDRPDTFTWIRGFHDVEARATLNAAFYDGPLWKEHSATMNDRLIDHTNVLLLQALRPEREILVLPAVDPVKEESGARGTVVAQVFAVRTGGVEAAAAKAEEAFAGYRAAGAREAGVLVTLDVPNNFPRLPFRTDGPYLVWLGILRDEATLNERFRPLAERASHAFSSTGLLRGSPELIVLEPTPRSRLRWLRESAE